MLKYSSRTHHGSVFMHLLINHKFNLSFFVFLYVSSTPPSLALGIVAEQFLSSTATQLTYHGLCELTSTVQEGELCVFFRNNHFSTMIRYKVNTKKYWQHVYRKHWHYLHKLDWESHVELTLRNCSTLNVRMCYELFLPVTDKRLEALYFYRTITVFSM